MTSIIKNQLLKHLSIYTKNLSSDKINLSTFRGEGELSNLELDERVLTELLELPSWLRLTSAWCNHVSFRISWTKLKSVPITLQLDEVRITVETCSPSTRQQQQQPSDGSTPAPPLPQAPAGKYSFINKIVDGITVVVNTVNVNFVSPAFTASVQMSRIRVESKTPNWAIGQLQYTRLKDSKRGILLIFKELSWQTVRIEASSTQDTNLTPLRLLTNQARCRITIRKRLSDCAVLASRLVLILDDLLWVLTDSQLKAALHFVDSLTGLIKEATHATQKSKAARKIESVPDYQSQVTQQKHSSTSANAADLSGAQRLFNSYDVRETSYHFFSQRIDLHLCDDESDRRSSYPELDKGGALQILILAFQIDYYPYHLAKSDRSHWPKYKEASVAPAMWLKDSLNAFRESLLKPAAGTAQHKQLRPTPPTTPVVLNVNALAGGKTFEDLPSPPPTNGHLSGNCTPTRSGSIQNHFLQANQHRANIASLNKLMSSCVVLRIEDFTLYRVTTSGKKEMPKEFISGDKDRYSFPAEIATLHAEFTYFYYPGDFVFPLPPSKAFVHINPLQLNFDLCSILWLNSFALSLHESLLHTSVGTPTMNDVDAQQPSSDEAPNLMYMDVKLEAIMPRIIIESAIDAPGQKDRPKIMEIHVSRFALTNIRELGSSRADLALAVNFLQESSLMFRNDFPSARDDMCVLTDRIIAHITESDAGAAVPTGGSSNGESFSSATGSQQQLTRYALWSEPRDVWCIKLDPVWVDFLGARSLGPSKAIPFIDAVPITLWLHPGNPANSRLDVLNAPAAPDDDKQKTPTPPSPALPRNPFLSDEDVSTVVAAAGKQFAEPRNADVHVIVHISNMISLQVDHYQLLFLLRLAEEFSELSAFISLDAERILQKQNKQSSLIVGCFVPQVELMLVMPSTTPGKETSGGDVESVLPDSASLGDDLHVNASSGTIVWQNTLSFDQTKLNMAGYEETPSPITLEELDECLPPTTATLSQPNAHGHNVQIAQTPKSTPPSSVSLQTQMHKQQAPSTTSSTSKSKSSARSSTTEPTSASITKELNSGFMSMRKGFSSFMTSIDSAIKSGSAPNDNISDTISIRSDISSDSDNYSLILEDDRLMDCMDVMFRLNPFANDGNLKVSPVEVASEVYEEAAKTNASTPSEPSETNGWRRRDLVSTITFCLSEVELIHQNEGYQSSLRLQVSYVACEECGAIPWDELQTKFAARCKGWEPCAGEQEGPPCLRARLEETLNIPTAIEGAVDRSHIKSWSKQSAEVRINNVNLNLQMSTVIGLADLAEDEIITPPMPVNIILENVRLNLHEDRPPVNITSPGPVPINLVIGRMQLHRDEHNVLNIQPLDTNLSALRGSERPQPYAPVTYERELVGLKLIMQQIKSENDRLQQQLNNTVMNNESYRQKTAKETESLRAYLKSTQDNIATLLEEKCGLLETIRALQAQITSTSKSSSSSTKKNNEESR